MRATGKIGMAVITLAALPATSTAGLAAPAVEYRVSFANAVHHEARIRATFRELEAGTLQLHMSRSSPGRYAIHEFAKNVYQVEVVDGSGQAVPVSRPDPYRWQVTAHDGTITVKYTLYGDHADGTYTGIDRTHAHLNMPATFMWAQGLEARPVEVVFEPFSRDWRVATQLQATRDRYRFKAPDLQYFLDSPTELSKHQRRHWNISDANGTQTIRLAVHHSGTDDDIDRLVADAKPVLLEQLEVFGELPSFDYGEYLFIADYLPFVSGDGMEHRNSTYLVNEFALHETDLDDHGHLRTLSHEFFHAWNAERLRPKSLEPFDFTRANMSGSLWFVEGFTSYYGDLVIRRAGVFSNDQYLEYLLEQLDYLLGSSGRQYFSPVGMSMQAPFRDAATSIDRTNFRNTYISYYRYGFGLALGLDLMIRERFPGKSLDDVMRQAWLDHGRDEHPYRPEALHTVLERAVGDGAFADEFFARYVNGHEYPDFVALLAQAGLLLQPANPDAASAGPVKLSFHGSEGRIAGATRIGSPLYVTGLDRGDIVLKLGRREIRSQDRWDKALESFAPGDTTTISYRQRGEELTAAITLVEDASLELKRIETEDELSSSQAAFRRAWLGAEAD